MQCPSCEGNAGVSWPKSAFRTRIDCRSCGGKLRIERKGFAMRIPILIACVLLFSAHVWIFRYLRSLQDDTIYLKVFPVYVVFVSFLYLTNPRKLTPESEIDARVDFRNRRRTIGVWLLVLSFGCYAASRAGGGNPFGYLFIGLLVAATVALMSAAPERL